MSQKKKSGLFKWAVKLARAHLPHSYKLLIPIPVPVPGEVEEEEHNGQSKFFMFFFSAQNPNPLSIVTAILSRSSRQVPSPYQCMYFKCLYFVPVRYFFFSVTMSVDFCTDFEFWLGFFYVGI